MFNIKKKKKGLTLIETLIAFTILTFVLTPMMMIINSSVKTNKSGEDKQKTLYIAQKYAEEFKRNNIDKNKLGQVQEFINADVPKGYFINVIVEPLTEYKFADVATATATTSSNTNNGYNQIEYDAKIKMIKDTSTSKVGIVAHIEVDDKNGIKGTYDLNSNSEYKLEINNGKDNNSSTTGIDNVLEIILKDSSDNIIAGSPWTVYKTPDTNKNANVIVQVECNEHDTSSVKLDVDCYNKIIDGNMSVYFARVKDTTLSDDFNKDVVNCSLTNQQGKVNIYSNIYNKSDTTNVYSNTDTRVYKITIRLFKDGQNTNPQSGDKPINQVVTYKTVQQ
jgi:Type II secretory pathway, pseudopilin PulG